MPARFKFRVMIEYEKAPKVTKQRIYLETMRQSMPRLGKEHHHDETGPSQVPCHVALSTDCHKEPIMKNPRFTRVIGKWTPGALSLFFTRHRTRFDETETGESSRNSGKPRR